MPEHLTDEQRAELREAAQRALEATPGVAEFCRATLALLDERDRLAAQVAEKDANPRDEYHTMAELYEYRMLYNAALFNEWAADLKHGTHKSWRHSDGEPCFGGGWFIVVATLPTGQISNHYKAEYWDLFDVPAVSIPAEYDGHTPQQVAERLAAYLAMSGPLVLHSFVGGPT